MRRLFGISLGLALAAALLHAPALYAASPSSGAVSESALSVTWSGGPLPSTLSANCGGPDSPACDNFRLEIVPPSYSFRVDIIVVPQGADDWDLQVYGPDGALIKGSGNAPSQKEQVTLVNPPAGVYTVSAAPYLVTLPYAGSATIEEVTATEAPPASSERAPTYANFAAPAGLGQNAGEPTLGVNEKTGSIMYIAGLDTIRVQMDGCSSPGKASWEDVSFITTQLITFDPLLYTQQDTGRTIVSQLLFPLKQSAMALTDDDGESWTPSQGSGINSGLDHQGVGGGPYAPGAAADVATYPRAIYYCAQDIALAECAVSFDGGLTFAPAVPIYDLTECGGLHGHPKVAPDGTVYVPNKGCGNEQAVVVSTDNGLTWTVRRIPGSTSGEWDPSVAIGADGTVYFAYGDGDGHPRVAVSRDRGVTWTDLQDVGTAFDIQNTSFPVVIAGDDDRAAFAFLGTSEPGAANADDPNFPGVWYLYVSHTYDGGKTWVTTNATPDDPVQRGTICAGGIGCGSTRNLLDFMDITVDEEGRSLVAYADGCVGTCVVSGPNSFSEVGSIARQVSGKRLYARFDQEGPPAAPTSDATNKDGVVYLSWQTPDDNGSAVSGYRIYERSASGEYALAASFDATVHSYSDVTPADFYQVRALNAHGEGAGCDVEPVAYVAPPAYDTCSPPGALIVNDRAGDQVAGTLDIISVSAAEPSFADGVHRVTFTIQVRDLAAMVAGNAWYIIWNRPKPDVSYDRNYVVMRATGTDSAEFKYGKVSPPSVNQAFDFGDADSGSFSKKDNTITITVSVDKIDDAPVGQDLSGVHVRSFAASLDGALVTQLASQDYTSPGNYLVRGFAGCSTNRPPDAVNDAATTRENKPVMIDLLANDSDPDGDSLTVVQLSAAGNGKVISKKNGKASYKPDAGFTGVDTFTYEISDGRGGKDTATATITVTEK